MGKWQAEKESAALQSSRSNDAETQWRHFVQSMEAWNRIVMNLVGFVAVTLHAASISPQTFCISPMIPQELTALQVA